MLVEVFLIIVVCYLVGLATYLQIECNKLTNESPQNKRHGDVTEDDIVKKNVAPQCHCLPNATSEQKPEPIEENDTTFANEGEKAEVVETENGNKQSSQIPSEKLDEVFSTTKMNKQNLTSTNKNWSLKMRKQMTLIMRQKR